MCQNSSLAHCPTFHCINKWILFWTWCLRRYQCLCKYYISCYHEAERGFAPHLFWAQASGWVCHPI